MLLFATILLSGQAVAGTLTFTDCPGSLPDSGFRCASYLTADEMHRLRVVILLPQPVDILDSTRPILFVHGGPGYPLGIGPRGARYWRDWVIERGWRQPVVMFDQRGVGGSLPVFNCPEYDGAVRRMLGEVLPPDREFAIWSEATARCRQRIASLGYRPGKYSSAANAADAAGIMRELQVKRWDAYGVSYGSRVLLELLQNPPPALNAVVLDSVVPLNRNPLDELPWLLGGGLERLFSACARQAECDAMLPIAGRKLLGLLAALQQEPQPITVRGPDGSEMIVMLHDRRLLESLFHGIYAQDRIERLPAMLAAAGKGDWQVLQPLVQHLVNWLFDPLLAEPVYYGTICRERHARIGAGRFRDGMRAYPDFAPYMSLFETYDLCKAWGIGGKNEEERAAPAWDGPVLLLAGEYDPVTPPQWAREVREQMPMADLYISPHSAHAVLDNDSCAAQWVAGFLAAPSAFSAPQCADGQRPLHFVTGDKKATH